MLVWIESALTQSLIEMQAWNAKASKLPYTAIPTRSEVATLSRNVVTAATDAASIGEALLGASSALRSFLARFTDRAVIVEKTPSNVFAFPYLSSGSASEWILCHREPFATISSLLARMGRDPFARDWGNSLEDAIGIYVRYAEQIASVAVSHPARAVFSRYESTCAEPSSLFGKLRAPPPPDREYAFVRRVSDREEWRRYTPRERWKILSLTEPFRTELGYDENYYGISETAMIGELDAGCEFGVSPLFGVFRSDEKHAYGWLSDRAAFVFYVPAAVTAISARCVTPGGLKLHDQQINASDGERSVGRVTLPPDRPATLLIDLTKAKPLSTTANGRLYKIDLVAEHARLPVASLPGNLDRRVVSCLMSPWTATMDLKSLT